MEEKTESKRSLYLKTAFRQIPRILTHLDTDETSPTYGCFDREYWHYRTADFPCGMSQEFVLPLALVFQNKFENNPYYQNLRIREFVHAGIKFAARSAHKDGSCDDYFPYERAYGATAFSLYAMTEAYLHCELNDTFCKDFFIKRAKWLSSRTETGRLTNHHSIAALALFNVWQITKDPNYRQLSRKKIDLCLSWQTEEGWFYEYEGCDPGYLTMTIDFLARYYAKERDEHLLKDLTKAVDFLDYFVYPDGTCGGEVGSRDTYIFMPHGLELLASHNEKAAQIKDRYLKALAEGRDTNFEDSRIFGHMTYSHLFAWLDYEPKKLEEKAKEDFDRYFPEAKMFVARKGAYYFVAALSKGGVFKIFKDELLIMTDTGLVLVLKNGKNGVMNKISKTDIFSENIIRVKGKMQEYRKKLATPLKQIIFRLILVLTGKIPAMSVFIRKLLQKMLIVGKKTVPVDFERTFELSRDGLSVKDTLIAKKKINVKDIFLSTDKVSIYIAMSECFHAGALIPWIKLGNIAEDFNKRGNVEHKRHIK